MVHDAQSEVFRGGVGIVCLAVVPEQVVIAHSFHSPCGCQKYPGLFPFHATDRFRYDVAVLDYLVPAGVEPVVGVELHSGVDGEVPDLDIRVQVIGEAFVFRYESRIAYHIIVGTGLNVVEPVVHHCRIFIHRGWQHLSLRLDIQVVPASCGYQERYCPEQYVSCLVHNIQYQNPKLSPTVTERLTG